VSVEAVVPAAVRDLLPDRIDPAVVLRRRQIFRLAFGMTLSAALAFGIAWPLSFITPVLTASLLTGPRALPLKAQIGVMVLLWISLTASSELLLPLLDFAAVHILITGLLVFLLFYAKAMGTNPLVVVLLLLGVVAVPLIGTINPGLARAASQGIFSAALVSAVVVRLAIVVFPDPATLAAPPAPPAPPKPSPSEGARTALKSVVVMLPLIVAVQMLSIVSATVGLVQAMLLTLEPTYGRHLKMGAGLLVAHGAGGMVAVVIYQLLIMVPSFWFFLMICTAAALLMGDQIFSGTKLGSALKGGIATFFVVLGPSLTGDAAAGADLVVRLLTIAFAVVYVVLAFGLMERLTRGRRRAA